MSCVTGHLYGKATVSILSLPTSWVDRGSQGIMRVWQTLITRLTETQICCPPAGSVEGKTQQRNKEMALPALLSERKLDLQPLP